MDIKIRKILLSIVVVALLAGCDASTLNTKPTDSGSYDTNTTNQQDDVTKDTLHKQKDGNTTQDRSNYQDEKKDDASTNTPKPQPQPKPKQPKGELLLEVNITNSSDDAEESSSGNVDLTSSDLEMVQERSNQTVGLRFRHITIPKGVEIISAYIQFSVDEPSSDNTKLTIHGVKTPNAKAIESEYNNITKRAKTTSSVAWQPKAWNTNAKRGVAQQTPDLHSILNEIISQSQWYSDNAVMFIISGSGKRVAVSYDGSSKNAPTLHIVYKKVDIDTDGDGKKDSIDTDDDNDGVLDKDDAFPKDKNEWKDTDTDGIGDNTDTDDDNDGVSDADEKKAGTNPKDKNDHPGVANPVEPVSDVAKYHRVVWDTTPSSHAVVGFTPVQNSQNYYIKYGQNSDETTWEKKEVTDKDDFRGSLVSYFARLDNLQADSAVYYRICTDSECGKRLWFKTAPKEKKPFVVIAGGDTRSGWQNRQDGNKLIAKIRPLFVMHGGDFTNSNNASQMGAFLKDWQLSFSKDTIDGVEYKRVYPLVPTHGNHEDGNYNTLCEVFGSDYDQDGQCTPRDTYGAFNVSPLLRVYTFNTEFRRGGWSSQAQNMNNWFENDIVDKGQKVTWRIAQYHKPMFPHYNGKPDNHEMFNWWANTFYEKGMNLAIESDTHIVKSTKIVKPTSSGYDYELAPNGGTLYVGEGSWGAEARSANNAHSWTQDMGAFQQFKVLIVRANKLDVKTAKFDAIQTTLTRQERAKDATKLPAGINWWNAKGIGESIILKQNSSKQSISGN